MGRIEKTVFISYRRSVSKAWARAVYMALNSRGYDVFLDYQGIGPGGFEPIILENLRSKAHFLILLGPDTLDRCHQPEDWLRLEIETALASRRNIVPLLFDGFSFKAENVRQQLTGPLAALPHYQAVRIHDDYFDEAMERLCTRYLSTPLSEIPHPVSAAARRIAEEQQRAIERDVAPQRQRWMSAQGEDEYGRWAEIAIHGVVQRLRWIEPGEFLMGATEAEAKLFDHDWFKNELPQHKVTLSQGYWLADTACTQALWQAVMGSNPSQFKDDPQNPAENVSWNDVQAFLDKAQSQLPDCELTLPTEAQWEYACRAGTQTSFFFGETINTDQVNYDGNYPYGKGIKGEYRQKTVPVKALPANAWGLYQMHGNVWEWCRDDLRTYQSQAITDPRGPEGQADDARRVARGGSWFNLARYARSAYRIQWHRDFRFDSFGFRFSLEVQS